MTNGVFAGTALPDERGYFGEFGGRFVPETLIPALDELEAAFSEAMADEQFLSRLKHLQAVTPAGPHQSASRSA